MPALVTVICLCYNHEKFVEEAIMSVFNQTYKSIQLIIVDDASTDQSQQIVKALLERLNLLDTVKVFTNTKNQGNCRSFNQALQGAKGKYVIDLAADDVMHPRRIEKQVEQLERSSERVAVGFTDSCYIDPKNRIIGKSVSALMQNVPSGDIFKALLSHSFICPTTLIFRREVLLQLGGYDETLGFEDLDIWFRVARLYEFSYLPEMLMYKRILPTSISGQRYRTKNSWLPTAQIVMQKVEQILKPEEEEAFSLRISNYVTECFWSEHFDLSFVFAQLCPKKSAKIRAYLQLSRWNLRTFGIHHLLLNILFTFKKYYYYLIHHQNLRSCLPNSSN